MARLTSSLPKGEANGLNAITRELIDSPASVQVAVVLLDCKNMRAAFEGIDPTTGEVL